MNVRRTLVPVIAAAALALPLRAPAAADAQPQAAADSPNCLNLLSIRSTRVIDDRTILFEMNGSKTYVNRLPNRCPGLKYEKRFLYSTSLSQLCGQDMITVLTDFGRGASCGLGRFETWVQPADVDGKAAGATLEPDPSQ